MANMIRGLEIWTQSVIHSYILGDMIWYLYVVMDTSNGLGWTLYPAESILPVVISTTKFSF